MPIVLIVDDVPSNLWQFFCRYLCQNGFNKVLLATNGKEAIERTQTEKPDIILMDLHMPIMDGLEATKRIKASKETKHIPIISISSFAFIAEDQDKALAAGCDDCQTIEKISLMSSRL